LKIKIRDIEINGVKILPGGAIVWENETRNLRSLGKITEYGSINSKTLLTLIEIHKAFKNSKFRAFQFHLSLLVEIIQRLIGCSRNTAYQYAKTLIVLGL